MNNKSFEFKIGVIGLGYVGTPLACLFSKKYDTWGYDIKAEPGNRERKTECFLKLSKGD